MSGSGVITTVPDVIFGKSSSGDPQGHLVAWALSNHKNFGLGHAIGILGFILNSGLGIFHQSLPQYFLVLSRVNSTFLGALALEVYRLTFLPVQVVFHHNVWKVFFVDGEREEDGAMLFLNH